MTGSALDRLADATDILTASRAVMAVRDAPVTTAVRVTITEHEVTLDDLRNEIAAFAPETGWLAFRSEVRPYLHCTFGDTGLIDTSHGDILWAEFAGAEDDGLIVNHVGDGQARVVRVAEVEDGGGVPMIRVPCQLVGEPPVSRLTYLQYWRVGHDGAAAPAVARLSGLDLLDEGEG